MSAPGLRNSKGQVVDLYIPRKCSITNRLIGPKDHASVQVSVAMVDEAGVSTGDYVPFAFCGDIRSQGGCDAAFTQLAVEAGFLKF